MIGDLDMRSVTKMEEVNKSNQLKRKVCNGCLRRLEGVLTNEQIKKFKEAFYLASKGYVFSENE